MTKHDALEQVGPIAMTWIGDRFRYSTIRDLIDFTRTKYWRYIKYRLKLQRREVLHNKRACRGHGRRYDGRFRRLH